AENQEKRLSWLYYLFGAAVKRHHFAPGRYCPARSKPKTAFSVQALISAHPEMANLPNFFVEQEF
ncbi:MAG: hypothetical protein KKF30_04475, partial [Proteobacteria bacterium]|nr:hypothetical protein [Pseudomonadota bacterium]MBU4471881.1 hypothetical protein [Pseudomonadota bacterium]MCG2752842.1 hypothetical protein [Desulfobacteraceae bacterium]